MDRPQGRYHAHYKEWQDARIRKIESVLGKEFFKDKTVLELACGYGDIGKHFRNLGANVTFAEGRADHLELIRQNNPGAEVIQLDQETNWDLGRQFDIVIHFGVTYHLDNWKRDFIKAMQHTKSVMIFESEIADSKNPTGEFKFKDREGYDQALSDSKMATRPSAQHVESTIIWCGGQFTRYDDADLNAEIHRYDWELTGAADSNPDYNRESGVGMRRFWIIKK